MREFSLRLVVLFFVGATMACSDGAVTTLACGTDDSCPIGTLCIDSVCSQVPCSGDTDCPRGKCVITASGNYCSAYECEDATDCGFGEYCEAGSCLPVAAECGDGMCTGDETDLTCPDDCTAQSGCGDGMCDEANEDVASCPEDCVAGPETQSCTETGCPAGMTCDQDTGDCLQETVEETPGVCSSCATDDECPAGHQCSIILSGKHCLPVCQNNDDCPTGWSCAASNNTCQPAGQKCEGCVADGCPTGGVCNTADEPFSCAGNALASCDACSADWECGADSACIDSTCMPRCTPSADTCPPSSTCIIDSDANRHVCKSDAAECCYGSEEECGVSANDCNPACSSSFPVCLDGTCVQCLEDGDCETGQTCDTQSNTCVDGGSTTAPVECGGTTCTADYPVCVELEGNQYCVQCAQDTDCAVGCTCDTQLYACSGDCVTAGGESCETNADCPVVEGFDLICHPSGVCVDTSGSCDGVTALCPFGNECISLTDALFGGGGAGLPFPLPTGGGGLGIPGACACDPASSGDCVGGVQCAEDLISGLTGQSGSYVCGQCESLLGSLLGDTATLICAFLGGGGGLPFP